MNEQIQAQATEAVGPDDFDIIVTDKTNLGEVLKTAPLVRRFLEAVETKAMAELLDGQAVEGFKLIQGRLGNRKWSNEEEVRGALSELGDSMFIEPKLKSPAQMEKALRDRGATKTEAAERVDTMTARDPAKPSMVPESQPGRPWSAEADFDIVK